MILTGSGQEPEFVAFVGIDWADQKHAWALQSAGNSRIEQGCIDHSPEAVEAWAAGLICRFGKYIFKRAVSRLDQPCLIRDELPPVFD